MHNEPIHQIFISSWIHGGGWLSGSSTTDIYGPDYLVERNVTIVTMNYRLGAYGFLSLDDKELHVPGNQAFKDQRMALQWVQVKIYIYHKLYLGNYSI